MNKKVKSIIINVLEFFVDMFYAIEMRIKEIEYYVKKLKNGGNDDNQKGG